MSPTNADDPLRTTGSPPVPGACEPPSPSVPGYEIEGVLGRGGMGVVYKARQVGLNRDVALKMILAGGNASEQDRERFRTEGEAVARLQHPHIVQIYEVGEHHGVPYFSLELCPGGSLEKKLAGTPLPAREAAALVEQLARGMAAAHEKGVIHRDLKPANVLLAEDGTAKITDFGLAKKLGEAGQTQSGAIVGTPSYMAPEQAGGKSKELGPACDIYALGAILYECLTGRPPFKAATALDTILQVVSDEPAPPRQLESNVPRDLETICLKCLRKEPARRYESAQALADDLGRWLAGEPIQARPTGAVERAVMWARRQPAVAGLWGAIVALSLAGMASLATGNEMPTLAVLTSVWVGTLLLLLKRQSLLHAPEDGAKKVGVLTRVLLGALAGAVVAPFLLRQGVRSFIGIPNGGVAADVFAGAATGGLLCAIGAARRRRGLRGVIGLVAVWFILTSAGVVALAQLGEAWVTVLYYASLVGAPGALMALLSNVYRWRLNFQGRVVYGALVVAVLVPVLLQQGMRFFVGLPDLGLAADILAGAATGALICALDAAYQNRGGTGLLGLIALWLFMAGWGVIALEVGGELWETFRAIFFLIPVAMVGMMFIYIPEMRKQLQQANEPRSRLWWAGRMLPILPVLAGMAATPYWLEWRDGAPGTLGDTTSDSLVRLAFTPGGQCELAGLEDGRLVMRVTGTWMLVGVLPAPEVVGCAAIAPGWVGAVTGSAGWIRETDWGRRFSIGEGDLVARRWDTITGKQVQVFKGHQGTVRAVAYTPDGREILTASDDGTMQLWDVASGLRVRRLKGYGSRVLSVAVGHSPGGHRALSGHEDGSVRLWDLENEVEIRRLNRHRAEVTAVAFAPDGLTAFSGGLDGTVRRWDTATGRQTGICRGGKVYTLAVSQDGRTVLAGGADGVLQRWSWPDSDGR